MNRSFLYREYVKTVPLGLRVNETTFREVCKTLTRSECRSLRALDYYVTDLLYEPRRRLESVLADMIDDRMILKGLRADLDLVYKFLQHMYHRQLVSASCAGTDPAYSTRFALGHPDQREASGSCTNISAVARLLLIRFRSFGPDLAAYAPLFHAAFDKAVLFMGHALRGRVQQVRIREIRLAATVKGSMLLYINVFHSSRRDK